MNLADTIAMYGVSTGGEPGRSTLPEDGTYHPESPYAPGQQRKRKQQVGGVDGEGSAPASLPDLYHVVDPMGRLLHKDMSYDDAKKASEARRYAKVIPARRGDSWQSRRIEEDKGKRVPSKIEKKILDRRSMPSPDFDYTRVG